MSCCRVQGESGLNTAVILIGHACPLCATSRAEETEAGSTRACRLPSEAEKIMGCKCCKKAAGSCGLSGCCQSRITVLKTMLSHTG